MINIEEIKVSLLSLHIKLTVLLSIFTMYSLVKRELLS